MFDSKACFQSSMLDINGTSGLAVKLCLISIPKAMGNPILVAGLVKISGRLRQRQLVFTTDSLGSVGTVISTPVGSGRSPGRQRILAYFGNHRTLLFAPKWRCVEFIKQCFMSHWVQNLCRGNCRPLPHVEPRVKIQCLLHYRVLATCVSPVVACNLSLAHLSVHHSLQPKILYRTLLTHLFARSLCVSWATWEPST